MGRTGTGWQSDVARQVVGRRRWDDTGRLSMAADPRLLAAHNIQPLSFFFCSFFPFFCPFYCPFCRVCVVGRLPVRVSGKINCRTPTRSSTRPSFFFFNVCVCRCFFCSRWRVPGSLGTGGGEDTDLAWFDWLVPRRRIRTEKPSEQKTNNSWEIVHHWWARVERRNRAKLIGCISF